MYRIKAPKNGAWVPILANPDIILEYNQNVVTTLHAKNLLLLGEDRFLSTLMLRTFPRRQMMFVPQARCKTVVPDQFKVLLSQRRRWINSTVHNLMELVLVSDLCGIACLSMQFSVFVDLIGTLVLPAAICLTIYLIVSTAVSSNPQWQSLALLVAILGLPAVLIGITTFKIVYIMWMLGKRPVNTKIVPILYISQLYAQYTSSLYLSGTLSCLCTHTGILMTFLGAQLEKLMEKRRINTIWTRRVNSTHHAWS